MLAEGDMFRGEECWGEFELEPELDPGDPIGASELKLEPRPHGHFSVMPFEWGSKNEDVAGWPPIIECMFPPNVRGLLAQLDMAEGGVGLWPCSSFGLGGGVTRTSVTENGLAAFAVDKGGVLSGEREGRGPEDVDDGDGAA